MPGRVGTFFVPIRLFINLDPSVLWFRHKILHIQWWATLRFCLPYLAGNVDYLYCHCKKSRAVIYPAFYKLDSMLLG